MAKQTKHKMYEMILNDNTHVYRVIRCGKSISDLKNRWRGNGEFVCINEVTNEFPISEEKLVEALNKASFGEAEVETIRTLLIEGYVNVC